MEASFVEIYNETLRDLLGNGEEKKHEIRHVEKSSTTVISDVQLGTGRPLRVSIRLSTGWRRLVGTHERAAGVGVS